MCHHTDRAHSSCCAGCVKRMGVTVGCLYLSLHRNLTSIPTLRYTQEQEMSWNDPANLGGFPLALTPQLFRNTGDVSAVLCSLTFRCPGQTGSSLVRSQEKGGSSLKPAQSSCCKRGVGAAPEM